MAFKLQTGPITAHTKVVVHHPNAGEVTFEAKFRILKHHEYQELVQGKKDDINVIQQILVGWSGVQDDDGKEVSFNGETLKELCAYSFVRTGIMRAYTDLHVGFSATKN